MQRWRQLFYLVYFGIERSITDEKMAENMLILCQNVEGVCQICVFHDKMLNNCETH